MEKEPSFENIEVTELKKVETVGIQSHVKRFSEIKKETVVIGHVPFFDFEDVYLRQVKDAINKELGFGFIYQSSEMNYHVIVPVIRSVAEIKDIKDRIDLDCEAHGDIGLKKGCWTLRAGTKGDKPAPDFIDYVESMNANPMTEIFSKPHLEYIKETIPHERNIPMEKSYIKACNMLNECKTVGDTFNAVRYVTHENNHGVDGQ